MPDRIAASRRCRFAGRTACTLLLTIFASVLNAQQLAIQAANSAISRWPNGHIAAAGSQPAWGFEPGIVLAGMNAVWTATHDQKYFNYIQQSVDQFVSPTGAIHTYDPRVNSLNNILIGRQLLMLYRATKDEKYRTSAATLYQQLISQPLTPSGGYWHAQTTPNLMMLDDEFMFAPFLAEYSVDFRQPPDPKQLAIIATQFKLLAAHARDPKTGLLYHGWDETRTFPWVNKRTGDSATLWSRSMGWYLMALVDTLPYYPKNNPDRAVLLSILQRSAAAISRAQDPATNLWYQVLDQPNLPGNYIESSSCLMLTYALAKGARLGYLPARDRSAAVHAWSAIRHRFVQTSPNGTITITGTVTHVSLGAAPQDDGSYNYYLHAPVVSDDPKGIGAFLLAATEMESAKDMQSAARNAVPHQQ